MRDKVGHAGATAKLHPDGRDSRRPLHLPGFGAAERLQRPLCSRSITSAQRTAAQRGAALMRLGVIADTHGLLRPQVFDAFAEVDHILHAGDLGSLDLLTELEALAPVTAVYGNTDGGDVRRGCPRSPRLSWTASTSS